MPIPEPQLETWSHQGSVTQSSSTYATIKRSLEAADKYAGHTYEVFLQGSYCNATNIYAESDVDVVICLDSVYYFDTSTLTVLEQAVFDANFIPATLSYDLYKDQVLAALERSFGTAFVTAEEKAIKVKAQGNRRSVDVVAGVEFQRYTPGPQIERGVCFFTRSGDRIVNYPKQHSANCTTKHRSTTQWFKPMVRILKNMRNRLEANDLIGHGTAPSYFLEGLLYNVPDRYFGTSYDNTFVASINWLLQADRSTLVCPNQQYYLVRDSAAECWPVADCNRFLVRLVELWTAWA